MGLRYRKQTPIRDEIYVDYRSLELKFTAQKKPGEDWGAVATLGYAVVGRTAPLLSAHVRRGRRVVRARLHAVGLAWKRLRYVFSQKEPQRAQKKGALTRRLKRMPSRWSPSKSSPGLAIAA